MRKNKFRIRPCVVIKDVIQFYIMSCFITVMILFFSNDELLTFTKITYSKTTWIVFSVTMLLEIFYNMVIPDSYWFWEHKNVTAKEPLGSATSADITSNSIKTYGKKVCAIHEAGHALIACLKNIEFTEISLSGNTPHVTVAPYVTDGQGFLDRIIMLYGGAAAEEVLRGNFGLGSFGDENGDFTKATQCIKTYIVMTDTSVSKTLLDEELAPKMIRLSKELYSTAKSILDENKEVLGIIADKLLVSDTLSEAEIKELMAETNVVS